MFLSPRVVYFVIATATVFSSQYGAADATELTGQAAQDKELSVPLGTQTTSGTGNLRSNNNAQARRMSTIHVESDGSTRRLSEVGRENGRVVNAHKNGAHHVFTFHLGNDNSNRIHVRSSPQKQELTIRRIGSEKKNAITEEDRAFLQNLADTARGLPRDQENDEVDTPEFQIERLAGLLEEWPHDLDIDFVFDKHKEMDRLAGKADFEAAHPIPEDRPSPPALGGSRLLHHNDPTNRLLEKRENEEIIRGRRSMVVVDNQGQRRLDYSSLCSQMNTFVATTHDDWNYDRWDDRTTFYAYVSNHPSCSSGSDGTWFWTGSAWSCYEADHDANIEYAYGGCFGRCGSECGGSNGAGAYTYDCLDHDSCVRFGHAIASFWCNDEFLSTTDDAVFAPNCI